MKMQLSNRGLLKCRHCLLEFLIILSYTLNMVCHRYVNAAIVFYIRTSCYYLQKFKGFDIGSTRLSSGLHFPLA